MSGAPLGSAPAVIDQWVDYKFQASCLHRISDTLPRHPVFIDAVRSHSMMSPPGACLAGIQVYGLPGGNYNVRCCQNVDCPHNNWNRNVNAAINIMVTLNPTRSIIRGKGQFMGRFRRHAHRDERSWWSHQVGEHQSEDGNGQNLQRGGRDQNRGGRPK